ncbi:Gfo/Idh/MocA family oxidoreductase [Paenibacillus sp. TRM 82003]|uniref:Gfo/Idh/MocA family protein n=1 Tax=Kineococcus sp. TRM81007 TaxID=2925831 RepID=UPI001F562F25|nr:Gfo/Idh/MocA family oxidoreductase [Kineococcus sp. TRM81007]MCI2238136.1 Gfo/Idh/MocA family oxidoreductase [Kineococcus sp. TRM81007]MCI3920520.1 Gfo/Idh/MocA family oxidoreductase [Paenibacillus sp. TRM 82003]
MTSTPSPRNVVVVGTGGIAAAHARALTALGDRVRLVAAVDVDAGRAQAFAEQWGVPRATTDLAEVLADTRVDLVHVCTPPSAHVPVAEQALAAGASVVVEKPIALSLAETDRLLAAEAASAGSVAVVSQHRFGSGVCRLTSIVADGTLGRPLVATCLTQWYRPDEYFQVPWRGSFEVEGGGPTMGHGIHQMDVLLSVLGPWEEVSAMASQGARPTRTEEVSVATVRFASGALASVVNSVVSPRETTILRFDLELATVEVHHLYGYGDDDFTVTAAPGQEEIATTAWAREPQGVPSGHEAQFREVLDALDAGELPPVPLAGARDTLELVAAIYRSAFTGGAPVRRGEIDAEDPFAARMDGTGAPWARIPSAR